MNTDDTKFGWTGLRYVPGKGLVYTLPDGTEMTEDEIVQANKKREAGQ